MNGILLTLIVLGFIKTLAIMVGFYLFGGALPMSNIGQLIESITSFVLMVWAIVVVIDQK